MSDGRLDPSSYSARCAVLVVDKPTGITSHDIVRAVRKILDEPRVGHTGTLDPFASGALIVCLGLATRLSEYFLGHEKRYLATIEFGVETDTYDRDGTVLSRHSADLTRERLDAALAPFRGTFDQTPPAWSALRVEGKRAHQLARKGILVELKPRPVTIRSLALESFEPPRAVLDITCSAGTYIRSLAHDLGAVLGCGAHVAELRRLRCGSLTIEQAVTLEALREVVEGKRLNTILLPPSQCLEELLDVRVDAAGAAAVHHGHAVPTPQDAVVVPGANCRIHDADGRLIAMGVLTEERMAQPRKVLR